MYILKLYKDKKRELAERELSIERTRQFMALFANANRGKTQREFTPQDFWRLSYDQNTIEEKPMTFKEAKAMFGSRIKKDNGGK
jgi:hypothetical protein